MKMTFWKPAVFAGIVLMSVANLKSATVAVEMRNNFFTPATVNINVGDTVTWIQRGSNHDTVSYDGLWASAILRSGQTFSHTFTTAGSFRYYCTPHESAGMIGTVNVQGAPNQPPTVSLTAPANGATFLTTDTITFSANAADNGGSITKVDFFAGANLIGSDTSSPYSVTGTLAAGTHSITARATDNAGATTTSSAISITVNAPNQPPTVALTAPANGATFQTTDTITFSATAADDNSVTKVEFFAGTTLIESDSTAPYSVTGTLPAGTHSITAQATDNTGTTTTSSAISITIQAPSVNQPRITSVAREADLTTLNVEGTTGIPHILEGSFDLISWTGIATNTPVSGTTVFTDSSTQPMKFYRVVAR